MTASQGAARVTELSLRQQLGTASARSLLLTVLGEFVLPHCEPVWTSTLVTVLGALGVEEKAARQALMRVGGDGWIAASRHGRRTRWALTPAGERLLADGSRRIFSFAGAVRQWNGQWLLIAVDAPEGQRALRQQLRTKLSWAGFGPLPGGLWISPRSEREAEARAVLDEVGLAGVAYSFHARAGEIGSAEAMISEAWDLDDIQRRYQDFLDLVSPLNPQDAQQALTHQLRLVQEWRRFPLLDPGLPLQLLPESWNGARAAELFHRRHSEWNDRAWVAWRVLAAR
ncbi:MAG: PaaX family transcriptional regulator [Frankia sp.]